MGKVQQSSVDLLPEHIREQLRAMLRDPSWTQIAAKEKINEILAAEGCEERMSYSAVNREALRMRKVGERIRQTRQMADMWIGKLGAAPQGQVGHLINETLRTLSFDLALTLQEGKVDEKTAPATIKMLKGLSLSVMRLEKAASENVKREEEIRRQERERLQRETLAAVDSADEDGGMTVDKLKEKIREVYGV